MRVVPMSGAELENSAQSATRERRDNARRLLEVGIATFGPGVSPTANLGDLLNAAQTAIQTVIVRIGRVARTEHELRLSVSDAHASIEARAALSSLGDRGALFAECLDPGDIVALSGRLN